ncbi:monodechloroaminopyrrolnitrin synthase PrnB family protein [Actinacidiphila sp. ITFR-21]|uniref:monodechloroaminopyrrolnitrin synthase PrnB family protein n=1 Tax=Actinacidiphila sp. ITFR-21 TaxID=3075199 RepID=UPI00288BAF5E|nr:monodechloroaminopyrrolnitrin synthase PrnB family protein [Streptomyces sp. ITFR-21]WNI14098.1 DUF1864 family protein [Streptomyces sp. ITFR-21]
MEGNGLRLTMSLCREVQTRDPLGADAALAALPGLNRRADVGGLVRAADGLAAVCRCPELRDSADRIAAMRDIGMFLSSLKRHHVEPVAAVPGLQETLLALGNTVGMVPRNTVLHYGPWNPLGARQRMFTGAHEESVLIDSVRISAPLVERAAFDLAEAARLRPGDEGFADGCAAAARRLAPLPVMIAEVAEEVDPAAFFAARLRPFMEEVHVDGRAYYGPAAAHVPLYLVDHLLWSCDSGDATHTALRDDPAGYGLPAWRTLFREAAGGESMVTRLVRTVDSAAGDPPAPVLRAAREVAALLRALVTFRGRHVRLARQAYADGPLYDTGSPGASPDVVRHVLALTRERAHQVRTLTSGDTPRRSQLLAPPGEHHEVGDAGGTRTFRQRDGVVDVPGAHGACRQQPPA